MPVGAMVGGVVGGFAILGLISFIFWYLRRRKRRRDSFLTPLGSDPGDFSRSTSRNGDDEANGPVEKLKAQIGSGFAVMSTSFSKLKARVRRDDKNGVNMNRGNSQFLERIPQHSRQNSALSIQPGKITLKDRFGNWIEQAKENYLFNKLVKGMGREKDPGHPFAAAREKQAFAGMKTPSPDFSQFPAMEERELQIASERRRQSLSRGIGINTDNPFADPVVQAQLANSNPFNDPANIVSAPKPSQPPPASNYVADVRRSRGQSISQPESRYPSTYAPDRESYGYRDTYMSSTTNGRKTKGRSDPFDLEKLRFEATPPPMPSNFSSLYITTNNNIDQARSGDQQAQPRIVSNANSENSAAGTYTSKYSSTMLSDWGDPGPDLGPGSLKSESGFGNLEFGALGGRESHARQDSDALGGVVREDSVKSSKSKSSVGKAY